MKLSQFKFKLPEDQIALYPHSLYREFENDKGEKETFRITRRDECRLMVLHKKSQTIDMYKKDADGKPIEGEYLDFRNVLDYFDEHDTFIFNDTKVFPARLYGTKEKTDAKIEVFLLRELNEEMRLWDVLVEPARKIRIGNKLFFDDSGTMVAEVIDNTTSRGASSTTVRTTSSSANCFHWARLRCHAISSTVAKTITLQRTTSTTSSVSSPRTKVPLQLLLQACTSRAS